jgi:flagellar biosynthesis protein
VVEDSPYFGTSESERNKPARSTVAVAIDNKPGGPGAPRVVATGRGALAEQILQVAFDRGVKVRSDADLAEILATLEIDSEVPLEALAAVAEILSYVYRSQARIASGHGA